MKHKSSSHHYEYEHQQCFIGHSREAWWSADIAAVCHEVLPRFNLKPWYAAEHFDPTKPRLRKVAEAIANARYGIYDLSYFQRERQGEWQMPSNVLIELGIAIALNRPTLLLRHANNHEAGLRLPECLESISEHIIEFSGQRTLQSHLEEGLQQWVQEIPEKAWWNHFCIFGGRSCQFREAHPLVSSPGQQTLQCFISDGAEVDRVDFRNVIEKVLERFNNIDFGYLNEVSPAKGYNFWVCGYCQAVRTSSFAIYRITSKASPETYLAIGISIGLENQFHYTPPRILLTNNEQNVPSLLAGYDVIIVQNDQETKSHLHKLLPTVLQQVHQTRSKPHHPLPFVETGLQESDLTSGKQKGSTSSGGHGEDSKSLRMPSEDIPPLAANPEAAPQVVVGAIIVNDIGEVLLTRQKKWKGQYSCFLGGHVGQAENMIEALRREIREEVDMDIMDFQQIGNEELIQQNDSREPLHYVFFNYLCRVPTSDFHLHLGVEVQEALWVMPESAVELVLDSNKSVLQKLLDQGIIGSTSGNHRTVASI